jgi:hypothetical protein
MRFFPALATLLLILLLAVVTSFAYLFFCSIAVFCWFHTLTVTYFVTYFVSCVLSWCHLWCAAEWGSCVRCQSVICDVEGFKAFLSCN